jgi:dTDP-glucose 4,6-dehydratase
MKRLLITGGAGFIGSNFVEHWLQQHPQDRVVVLDALTYAGNKNNLQACWNNPQLYFVQGDINDQALVENLLRTEELDTIVHFAAESHVDRSIAGPDIFVTTNIVGTHSLLKAARQVWLEEGLYRDTHRFHHVSTDEVYGSLGPNDPPFTEQTPYAPNSPYSASKAASDHLVRAYQHTYQLNTSLSNCSNNFGPKQHAEKLIPTIIRHALAGEPIPIYGNGKNIRDWLYVSDHCKAIECIVLDDRCVGEMFNVGGHNELDNLQLTHKICELLDQQFIAHPQLVDRYPHCPAANEKKCQSLISFVKDRAGHDFRYAIDSTKFDHHFRDRTFKDSTFRSADYYLAAMIATLFA